MSDVFNKSLDEFCIIGSSGKSNKGGSKSVDVHLYGVVGGLKVNAEKLQESLSKAGDVDTINVYLNTYGGTFGDGLAIYNILKSHEAFVVIRVMGYALSMGSIIMLAADRVECVANGLVMIHRAQGLTYGCATDHKKTIEVLLKHEQTILPLYENRLGLPSHEVMELLQEETWYTATEAKLAGLIDLVVDEVEVDESGANAGADGHNVTAGYRYRDRLPMSIQMAA